MAFDSCLNGYLYLLYTGTYLQISTDLSKNYSDSVTDREDTVIVHMGLEFTDSPGGLDMSSPSLPPQVSIDGGDFSPLVVSDWRFVSVGYDSSLSVTNLVFTPDLTELSYSLSEEDEDVSASSLSFNSPNGTLSFTALADGSEDWLVEADALLVLQFPLEDQSYEYVSIT